MLVGKLVKLRAWEDSDVSFFNRLRNDVAILQSLMSRPTPQSTSATRRWLQDREGAADGIFLVIETIDSPAPVGFVELRSICHWHRRALLGLAITPESQGRGMATESLAMVEEYSASQLGLRKICLEVLASNEPAVNLYLKRGFHHIGTWQKHSRSGEEWCDVMLMEKLLLSPTTE